MGVVFVAEVFTSWLIEQFADAGSRRLMTFFLGDEQERSLRSAATAAIQLTADELCAEADTSAEQLVMVIDQVFSEPLLYSSVARHAKLLPSLQDGISAQLEPLSNADLTETGRSSLELLGVQTAVLAEKLTSYILREIAVRGARGGPLEPLANQLNHEVTQLQGQRIEGALEQLVAVVRKALGEDERSPLPGAQLNLPLGQRRDVGTGEAEHPSWGEVRQDLIVLLHGLDEKACTGWLPPYLPASADVRVLSRVARVRPGVRSGLTNHMTVEDPRGQTAGSMYRLPVERSRDGGPPRPWPELAAEHRRLVVLADPGLGKSWLMRTETHRLCLEALARLDIGPETVIVPVPMRCDQLAAAAGQDLAEKVAAYLVAQQFLPERSRAVLAAKVRAGEVVLLLDALDELTSIEQAPLRQLLRSWSDQVGEHARCVVTTRIAGYTGSPFAGACEVELQAFTTDDVAAAIAAWQLSQVAERRLLERVEDPAISALVRIPLLLALICSVTAQRPANQAIPRTRGQLYDRMLRWFLTHAHRSPERPNAPILDNVGVEALLEVIAPLAVTFAVQPGGWIDLMPCGRLLDAIRDVGPAFNELHCPAVEVLRDLSIGAGVLVPESDPSAGRSPNYLFLHRTVAEYLVAYNLSTLPEADWLSHVQQHQWFDPNWTEVIPMLGERLKPSAARTLIQHLLTGETDPFHHSLLTALRVWGARPDADHLLSPEQAAKLTEQFDDLFCRPLTGRAAVTSLVTAMPYLPQPLIARLLTRLHHEDMDVRDAAVEALVGRDAPGVTEALLACLGDEDQELRTAAEEALAEQDTPGLARAMVACLSDENRAVRYGAAQALAGYADPGVTEALIARLVDDDAPVRCAAAQALADRDAPEVTQALLASLDDEQRAVRCATVGALAGRTAPGVTDALVARLVDEDASVRFAAAQALAGRDEPAVAEALLARLEDQDWLVRNRVRNTLSSWDAPSMTDSLLARLHDRNGYVRTAAAEALVGRDLPGGPQALLASLDDKDEHVRKAVMNALACWDDPCVTQALLASLGDQDQFVRQAAKKAVSGRDTPDTTEALVSCVSHQDQFVRIAVVDALAGRDEPGVTGALLARLGDDSVSVREAAARALAGRQAFSVTEALLSRVSDEQRVVRFAVVEALADRDAPRVTQALLGRLGDKEHSVRWAAAQALISRKAPDMADALLARLGDQDQFVRQAVVGALAAWTGPRVTQALLACMDDENRLARYDNESLSMREALVKALASRDTRDVTRALLGCLDDEGVSVREAAAQALAGRDAPGLTDALLARLDDESYFVRVALVKALAGRDAPRVTDALLARLDDESHFVRQEAAQVLASHDSPQVLVALAKQIPRLGRSSLPQVVYAAEQLTVRHYGQIGPAEQSPVRAAMGWLTRALIDDSP